ncbi:MAG: hypothetical protein ACFFDB_00505 [Promethearchaeota archaeon]
MIRIDIPEDFIVEILSDIKELAKLDDITESTKKLFREIEIQANNYTKNRLTNKEEELGLDLGEIFEMLSFKEKIKKEIMDYTNKHLKDRSLDFRHISADLKRKYFAHTLFQTPILRSYNLIFDLEVSYNISDEIVEDVEKDILKRIEICKECDNWSSDLTVCMGCDKIEIKKALSKREKSEN